MSVKKNALGRGLGALLENPGTDVTTRSTGAGPSGTVAHLAISAIETNPFQPRSRFDQEALDELAESIKQHGIIQPLTVRKLGYDKYQLISGERRFRASQLAGLTQVPAYVRVANDQAMLEMALIENIQREDLDAIEVAVSYQRLIDECNLTQEELAQKVGKKRSTVTNFLRLLKLPADIQKAIMDRKLSMGHARALAGIDNAARQIEVFKQIMMGELSVREAEEASRTVKTPRAPRVAHELPIEFERLRQQVADQLGAHVDLKADVAGKGSLTIKFSSSDDLKRLLSMLDLIP